jgi:hypothetical protein
MLNETHRTPPRYKISDFFSSLLGQPAPTLVDPGRDHEHIIRNEGSVAASTIAVQLVPYDPNKANRRIDAPAPANCSNIL